MSAIDVNSNRFTIIGEIDINHKVCLKTTKRLMGFAVEASCSAVNFQERDLASICTA